MTRRLRYTDEARDDLDAIWRWQRQPGSGPAAWGRLKAVREAINRLRLHPCRYPIVDYSGVRELPCQGGYRALYEVDPDTGRDTDAGDVRVLRIYGPGQDRGRY